MKKKTYWYPYCGWNCGFCTSTKGCIAKTASDKGICKMFRYKHPMTHYPPVMLGGTFDNR